MLIVAIPKSASTSLMTTLERLHKLKSKQVGFPKNKKIKEINYLDKFHSDIRELKKNQIKDFESKKIIFKQHIYPSKNNLTLLKNTKKVILLRDPEEIINSYFRSEKKYVHQKKEFANLKTKIAFLKKIKQLGLYEDLKSFRNKWEKQNKNSLIIEYKELTSNPIKTINNIEKFFDLEMTKKVKLDKKRYSRTKKPVQIIINYTKIKLMKIKKLFFQKR